MNDTEDHSGATADEPVYFDVLMTPHRSLPPQGFVILMAAVGLISFGAGVVFFLVGAWPVIGFLGLDVLLIYMAFRFNYRQARMYESLRLTADRLEVRRVDHRGDEASWQFQPTWLQVMIDEPPRLNSPLTLRSHGRSLVIGAFLTPDEKLELARALRSALVEARAPAV